MPSKNRGFHGVKRASLRRISRQGILSVMGMRAVIIGVVLVCAGARAALAADVKDPAIGTWTLNVSKSTFGSGLAPLSQIRTYSVDANGVTLTIKGLTGDDKPIDMHATFRYDGKDYPYVGSANYDVLAVKRINRTTVKSTLKRAGVAVGTSTRIVSSHGSVLTMDTQVTDPQGKSYHDISVYDKTP